MGGMALTGVFSETPWSRRCWIRVFRLKTMPIEIRLSRGQATGVSTIVYSELYTIKQRVVTVTRSNLTDLVYSIPGF